MHIFNDGHVYDIEREHKMQNRKTINKNQPCRYISIKYAWGGEQERKLLCKLTKFIVRHCGTQNEEPQLPGNGDRAGTGGS